MADTRGGIILEAPRPNPTCYACGKEIELSEDLAREYAKTPRARLRHEQCPSDAAAPVALNRYRVRTEFVRLDDDPFDPEADAIETTLMVMSHDTPAATLGAAWDDLCIGIVSKYNQASMHTALAEAEAVPEPVPLTPEEERAEMHAAADPADLEG